jgi:hypothetical protein
MEVLLEHFEGILARNALAVHEDFRLRFGFGLGRVELASISKGRPHVGQISAAVFRASGSPPHSSAIRRRWPTGAARRPISQDRRVHSGMPS